MRDTTVEGTFSYRGIQRRDHDAVKAMVVIFTIVILSMPYGIPILEGNVSGELVKDFENGSNNVLLSLRGPGFKDSSGIDVPSDGFIISTKMSLEGRPKDQAGHIEHSLNGDFQGADTLEHLEVDNDSVSLGKTPDQVPISSANDWGDGKAAGLVREDTLSLERTADMAFAWDNVLSNASNQQENIKLAIDSQGTTHAVWEDNRKGLDIYYARSFDGVNYEAEKILDNLVDRYIPQQSPDMTIGDDDTIHVVYADGRTTQGDYDIYYTKSTDGGNNFQTEVRVDHGGTNIQSSPAIAVDGSGSIHVVWVDGRDGNNSIYYSKDMGAEFRVSNSTFGDQMQPDITIDSNGWVHVTWRDDRDPSGSWKVYHSRLAPGGTKFQDETRMNPGPMGTNQFASKLERGANGRIYIAWHDNRALEYSVYLSWTDDGHTFKDPIRVSTKLDRGLSPSMAFENDILHLTWYDYREGNYNIYYRNSTDHGLSFSKSVRVNNDNGSKTQRNPAIAVGNSGWPSFAWVDFRQHGSGDIFATKGTIGHEAMGNLEVWSKFSTTPFNFTGVSWIADLPTGTMVDVQGSSSMDNSSWSGPVDLVREPFNLTPGRYLHINISISTLNGAYTPVLDSLWVNYTRYFTSGTMVSALITTTYSIPRATLEWELNDLSGSVNVSVTVDGGSSWTEVENGQLTDLAVPGTILGYKVDMHSDNYGTPVLVSISVDYLEESFPSDLELRIGDTKVWSYSGPFSSLKEIGGWEDAINDYLSNLGNAGTRVNVPIVLTGKAVGDVLLSGMELDVAEVPTITDHGPRGTVETVEGNKVVFWVSVHENDARPLSYVWSLDGEVVEGENNRTLDYIPDYLGRDPRTEHMEVEVSNGYLMVSEEWPLVVEPANRAPILHGYSPTLDSILVDKDRKIIDFSINASDPDQDALSVTWKVDRNMAGTDPFFSLDPNDISEGSHSVEVEVSDGTSSVSQVWTVMILPIQKVDPNDGNDQKALVGAILILLVIITCVIVFIETFKRARGNRRVQRKRFLDEEERLLLAGKKLKEIKREQMLLRKGKVAPRSKKRALKKGSKKGGNRKKVASNEVVKKRRKGKRKVKKKG